MDLVAFVRKPPGRHEGRTLDLRWQILMHAINDFLLRAPRALRENSHLSGDKGNRWSREFGPEAGDERVQSLRVEAGPLGCAVRLTLMPEDPF